MPHAVEEEPLTKLPHILWASSPKTPSTVVNLSRCAVFEYNFPKAMYVSTVAVDNGVETSQPLAGDTRDLQRVAGRDLDSSSVVDLLCSKRATAQGGDDAHIGQVIYIEELGNSNASMSPSTSPASMHSMASTAVAPRLMTQYFTRRGLKYFMQGASAFLDETASSTNYPDDRIAKEVRLLNGKSGLLQRLPESHEFNEMIQVMWTPRVTMCEKLRNVNAIQESSKTVFDRYCTFDGPANIATRKFLAPAVQESVLAQVGEILRRVARHIPGKAVRKTSLYFKADVSGVVWFMFCTMMQLGNVPSPEAMPIAQAGRLAAMIIEQAAVDHSGRLEAGPRPLSLVEFTEADVQRDFMLLRMTTSADALAMASESAKTKRRSASALSRGGETTAPPFSVPQESKLALLAGLTRGATRSVTSTRWNEIAPTALAVASGIATVRSREEMASVDLSAPCFMPKPIDNRCLDEAPKKAPPRGDPSKSRFAPPMPWLRSTKDLLAHRYTNQLSRHGRSRRNGDDSAVPFTPLQ